MLNQPFLIKFTKALPFIKSGQIFDLVNDLSYDEGNINE